MKFFLLFLIFVFPLFSQANEENLAAGLNCPSCFNSFNLLSQNDNPAVAPPEKLLDEPPVEPTDLPIKEEDEITTKEKVVNFGVVYAAQWTYYLIGQHSIIKKNGSYENWLTNPFKPHFDKDNFEYNIFKHTLTGNYYYLWYRSRGYDVATSFFWTFISSLAFEFTIETATEQPSYQDIYQTPVFGTVLGVGVEKASEYFHSLDNTFGHTMGYILNPFTLIPKMKKDKEKEVTVHPFFDQKEQGVIVSWKF